MEEQERGFETLEFYQDSLKLLKEVLNMVSNISNHKQSQKNQGFLGLF